jgi:hypothetical protein
MLAQSHFGDSASVKDLWELNKLIDVPYIQANMNDLRNFTNPALLCTHDNRFCFDRFFACGDELIVRI